MNAKKIFQIISAFACIAFFNSNGMQTSPAQADELYKLGLTEPATLELLASYKLIKTGVDIDKATANKLKELLETAYSPETKKLLLNLLNNPDYVVDVKKLMPEKSDTDKQKVLDLALWEVISNKNNEFLINPLVRAGANVDAKFTQLGLPLLMEAANDPHGSIPKVKQLLSLHADINATDVNGDTLLMHVSKNAEDIGFLKILLSQSADPNFATPTGATALIYAASGGNFEAVKLLLKAGADTKKVYLGRTALDFAIKNRHNEIVNLLSKN